MADVLVGISDDGDYVRIDTANGAMTVVTAGVLGGGRSATVGYRGAASSAVAPTQ